MRDDGIGIRVAGTIKDELAKEDIETVIAETDFEYALYEIQDGDYVIVLDAMITGKRPGSLLSLPLKKVVSSQKKQFSQHEMNLIDLISGNKKINGHFIGVEAAKIGYGMDLSKELSEMYDSICNKVKKKIFKCKVLANI